ncbi:MAG: RDD family protein [Thermoleophilaceae bacterium]|nr:RDD family protein [Thermoleophilaceae bacterium]
MPPGGWQQPIPRASAFSAGFVLAGWGSRVGATMIDVLILALVSAVLIAPGVVVTFVTDIPGLGIALWLLGALVVTIVALLYASYFMQRDGARNGQTPGKQALGIRVAFPDGRRVDWGQALLRELVIKGLLLGVAGAIASVVTFFLFGLGFAIPYILDYLWPLWDEENRAVHDMIVNTRVIKS